MNEPVVIGVFAVCLNPFFSFLLFLVSHGVVVSSFLTLVILGSIRLYLLNVNSRTFVACPLVGVLHFPLLP